MRPLHRSDSDARRHYTMDQTSFISLTPELLYSGQLNKLQGWHDAPHSHAFLEIIFVLDGEGTVVVDEREYRLQINDIVIYNAGASHCEYNSAEAPMEARFIAYGKIQLKELPPSCILPPSATCVFSAEKFRTELIHLFDLINKEISIKDAFYIEIAERAAHTLLMYVFRVLNENRSAFEMLKKDTILRDALACIDKNFIRDIDLEEIAASCFANKYYLSHLFTERLGMTMGQLIREKRVELAKTLLAESSLNVSEIAERCGFNDMNYFVRIFKKSTKQTPLHYRKFPGHQPE